MKLQKKAQARLQDEYKQGPEERRERSWKIKEQRDRAKIEAEE